MYIYIYICLHIINANIYTLFISYIFTYISMCIKSYITIKVKPDPLSVFLDLDVNRLPCIQTVCITCNNLF